MLFLLIEARINNYDFTYRQILNILFIGNKRRDTISVFFFFWKKFAFLGRDTISPMEPHVSYIFIPNNFVESGD